MTDENLQSRYGDWALYRRLAAEARPMARHVVGAIVLGLLAAPLALLLPLPLKLVVDSVIGGQPVSSGLASFVPDAWQGDPQQLLLFAALAVVAAAILLQIRNAVYDVNTAWIGSRLVLRLRARVFEHIQRLSLAYHSRKSGVDALYRVQVDALCIETVLHSALPILRMVLQVVLVLVVTAQIDATLMWVALIGGPLVFGSVELYRRRLRAHWTEAQSTEADALTVAGESISAARLVQAFGLEERQDRAFRERGESAVSRDRCRHPDASVVQLPGRCRIRCRRGAHPVPGVAPRTRRPDHARRTAARADLPFAAVPAHA